MRRSLILILVIGAVLSFHTLASGKPAAPPVCIDKMDSIPDLTQTDPKAGFPHGGVHYCGPVAVSNSLMWLAEKGYDELIPLKNGRKGSQADLALTIASERYMNTTIENGTSPTDILIGISRYVADCGYPYRRLQYQGWRKHPRKFSTGVAVPELDWIKSSLMGNSAVWLNVGWYKYNPARKEYKRMGGHWVTLVGFGVDEHGNEDPNILVIHDPSPRRGLARFKGFVRLEPIKGDGAIKSSGLSVDARGYYKLTRGMSVKRSADCAILDGAVALELENR